MSRENHATFGSSAQAARWIFQQGTYVTVLWRVWSWGNVDSEIDPLVQASAVWKRPSSLWLVGRFFCVKNDSEPWSGGGNSSFSGLVRLSQPLLVGLARPFAASRRATVVSHGYVGCTLSLIRTILIYCLGRRQDQDSNSHKQKATNKAKSSQWRVSEACATSEIIFFEFFCENACIQNKSLYTCICKLVVATN